MAPKKNASDRAAHEASARKDKAPAKEVVDDEDKTSESEDESSKRNQRRAQAILGETEGPDFRIEEYIDDNGDIIQREIRMTAQDWKDFDAKLEHDVLNDPRYKHQSKRYDRERIERESRWHAEALFEQQELLSRPGAGEGADKHIPGVIDWNKSDKKGPTCVLLPETDPDATDAYIEQEDGSFVHERNSKDVQVPAMQADGKQRMHTIHSSYGDLIAKVYQPAPKKEKTNKKMEEQANMKTQKQNVEGNGLDSATGHTDTDEIVANVAQKKS